MTPWPQVPLSWSMARSEISIRIVFYVFLSLKEIDTWTRMGLIFIMFVFLFVCSLILVRYDSFVIVLVFVVVGSLIELCMQYKAWKPIKREHQSNQSRHDHSQTTKPVITMRSWLAKRLTNVRDIPEETSQLFRSHTRPNCLPLLPIDTISCWLQIARRDLLPCK